MKTLKAQLEVKTQEYEETILNWKKGEENLGTIRSDSSC